jgi:uncharacterized protein YjbI with pentapeptide repeats
MRNYPMKRILNKKLLLPAITILSILVTTGASYSQNWFVNKKCMRCDLTRFDLAYRNLQGINFQGTNFTFANLQETQWR